METQLSFRPKPIKESSITKEECVQMLKWRENRKLDVLSEMSNPFKPKLEQGDMVIKLQLEKCQLLDDFWKKFGREVEEMELAAKMYELMKSDQDYEAAGMSRDALVIQN